MRFAIRVRTAHRQPSTFPSNLRCDEWIFSPLVMMAPSWVCARCAIHYLYIIMCTLFYTLMSERTIWLNGIISYWKLLLTWWWCNWMFKLNGIYLSILFSVDIPLSSSLPLSCAVIDPDDRLNSLTKIDSPRVGGKRWRWEVFFVVSSLFACGKRNKQAIDASSA